MEIAEVITYPHQKAIRVSFSHESPASSCPPPDAEQDDSTIANLLNVLEGVKEQRKARGKIYRLVFILATSLVAVLGGSTNYRQIADQVADFPQELLGKLGGKWCYFRRSYRTPSEKTIRLVLAGVDADHLDRIIGTWLREHTRRDHDGALRIAIDGKVLRGVWTGDDHQFTLFSAMIHHDGVTIAQVRVPPDTNEITQVKALLDPIEARDGQDVVVTMDAAHTQRDTASYLAETRGFDYIMNTKGNQPTLLQTVFKKASPLIKNTPDHIAKERAHGRINQWKTWTTDADGIDFPHAQQIGCIRRDVFALDGIRTSREYAWIITSLPAEKTTAADLHDHVRAHWGIENKSHYVRDTTWREDAHHANAGNAPHIMATLRNTAASLLRLHGHHHIKKTTEWICRDPRRALPLMIT
jgi:predicted transposase YbfD/YdcC